MKNPFPEAAPHDLPSPAAAAAAAAANRRVNDIEYLTSEEVLQVLGIKKASLYTYVSRGMVRTIKRPGQKKANLYLKSDVDRLRSRFSNRHGVPVVSHSLRYGEPVVQSWICEISAAGPRYRGYLASDLVRDERSFEFVAELVWSGLPRLRDSPWPCVASPTVWLAHEQMSEQNNRSVLSLLARTALGMTSLELQSAETAHLDARSAGIRLIQAFTGTAGWLGPGKAYAPQLGEEYTAQVLMRGLGLPASPADPSCLTLMNAALVLSADHELSAPTFVARICASTGADLHACVIAALMAQSGPMQLGGMTDLEFLLQADAARFSGHTTPGHSALLSMKDIPCFGHPLYDRDPRANVLLELTRACALLTNDGRALLETVDHLGQNSGRHPNLFAARVIMARALGLPAGTAALINTVGRTAGWVAHAVEQRLAGAMLRPRAQYMGKQHPRAGF